MKRLSFLMLFLASILLGACENNNASTQVNSVKTNSKITTKGGQIINFSKKENLNTQVNKTGNKISEKQIHKETKIITGTNLKVDEVKKTKVDPVFSSTKVYSGEKISKYSWFFSMRKPKLSEMTNWNSILSGFHKKRTQKVLITPDDISDGEVCIYDESNEPGNVKTIKLSEQEKKKILNGGKYYVTITGEYQGNGYKFNYENSLLKFSSKQISFFKNHGWVILNPNWNTVDYSKETANQPYDYDTDFKEEWNNFIRIIGGNSENYERYPYNTVYISSDFLLHVFHKVFDNELKYKEETDFRTKIGNIAQVEFEKYKNKYSSTQDKDLKNIYGFLVSYEAIESSLLLPQKQLLGGEIGEEDLKNPSDEVIKKMIVNKLKSKISFLSTKTQDVILKEMDLILKAEGKEKDPLILYFFPNDKDFEKLQVKQDFTQFRPRSHYTTDSLLKTYFMGMKWMMREKFYFKSSNLSKSALILAKNLDKKELSNMKEIQDFVTKLIGGDDDVNIFDLRKFAKDNNLITDQDVMSKFNESVKNKLLNLKEQKIISTSYTTDKVGEKTEKQSHDDTVGFVFFGEKFTIDSWMFDKLTAGSAGKEGSEKPAITTALVVPYVLNDNSIAGKLTKIWLKENKVNENKANNYMNIAKKLIKKVQYFDFSKNIYSQWLDTLNYIFVQTNGKKPYWLKDNLYKLRKLLTYMGSYTELKHDTLLYVKQAYSELGGGGPDGCIEITPPALPVPKGYVEPNVDLIDQLIKLSDETNKIMKSDKFTALNKKLKFLKQIALAEIKNKKISDEDFEKLRLIDFIDILRPNQVIGKILHKEARGAIIGDIFNSSKVGALYEALGRPNLILMMIKDTNGARIVLGPVYTHYEFYKKGKRYTDEQWQDGYDKKFKNDDKLKSLEYKLLEKAINK